MKYTPQQVEAFSHEMIHQLEIHDNEKNSAANMAFGEVNNIVINELDNRIHILKTTANYDVIKAQCVHMANFLFIYCDAVAKMQSGK